MRVSTKGKLLGALAGVGMLVMVAGGMCHPQLGWPEVAMVSGMGLASWGISAFSREVSFMEDE